VTEKKAHDEDCPFSSDDEDCPCSSST
jgi:hypothetical protein